jgi:hypothetical protein
LYHNLSNSYRVLFEKCRNFEINQTLDPKEQFEKLCNIQAEIDGILYSLLTQIHDQEGLDYENFEKAKDFYENRANKLKQHPSYSNSLYDQLVKVGTHKAFQNTFLRQAVTGK